MQREWKAVNSPLTRLPLPPHTDAHTRAHTLVHHSAYVNALPIGNRIVFGELSSYSDRQVVKK